MGPVARDIACWRGETEGGPAALSYLLPSTEVPASVIASRANDKAGRGQDVVWRVDISKAHPRPLRSYLVGLGNAESAIGLVAGTAADRMDFPSVALLPDGRIAAAFQDGSTPRHVSGMPATGSVLNPTGGHNPALAILD